jgi:hypothetical protein
LAISFNLTLPAKPLVWRIDAQTRFGKKTGVSLVSIERAQGISLNQLCVLGGRAEWVGAKMLVE